MDRQESGGLEKLNGLLKASGSVIRSSVKTEVSETAVFLSQEDDQMSPSHGV